MRRKHSIEDSEDVSFYVEGAAISTARSPALHRRSLRNHWRDLNRHGTHSALMRHRSVKDNSSVIANRSECSPEPMRNANRCGGRASLRVLAYSEACLERQFFGRQWQVLSFQAPLPRWHAICCEAPICLVILELQNCDHRPAASTHVEAVTAVERSMACLVSSHSHSGFWLDGKGITSALRTTAFFQLGELSLGTSGVSNSGS